MAKIKNFTKYFEELQTLNISDNLEKYYYKQGKYQSKINTLQQRALIELTMLSPDELKGQQKRLQDLADKFERFWDWYFTKAREQREGHLQDNEFLFFLPDYFIIKKEHKGSISQRFLHNLHDAAMIKHGSLLALIEKIKPETKVEKITFKTTLSDQQIQTLFNNLNKRFIDTDYNIFKAVFSGVPLGSIDERINWIGANNLLAYFIDALIREKYIKEGNHWNITKHCFTNSRNLANASRKYKETKEGQPKQADIINEILKGL